MFLARKGSWEKQAPTMRAKLLQHNTSGSFSVFYRLVAGLFEEGDAPLEQILSLPCIKPYLLESLNGGLDDRKQTGALTGIPLKSG